MQRYHASNVFYVLALGLSNASVSWLMVRINSSRAPLVTRSLKGIMAFVVLWTVAMVFVMLFACPLGDLAALSTEQCPNWVGEIEFVDGILGCSGADGRVQYPRWLVLDVGASGFEIAITAVAIWNVWGLNTSFATKALVVALFGLRLP